MARRSRSPRHSRRASLEGRPRLQRILLRYGWMLPVGAIVVGVAVLGLTYAFASIPLPNQFDPASSTQVYDRNGRLIGTFSGEQRRFLIDAQKLLDQKPYIGQAVIAAEDRAFYDHNGVSVRGIMRAAWANLTGGEVRQGGSTITQQYVKNALLQDTSRTIDRKVREGILAIKLERRFSKKEILAFYLNTIYLGRGAYGIEAAARTYFDKHAGQLTLAEATFLAGIIPRPESLQPDEEPEAAQARRDGVLREMERMGFITSSEYAEASEGPVELAADGDTSTPSRQRAAYFMEWLRRDVLEPEFGSDLYTGGFKVYTTLDLEMQRQAEQAVRSVRSEWRAVNADNDPQASLVSMTPTGAVRALVGSSRQFHNIKKARGFNFATSFPGRQAGSSFKPYTLLTAIKEDIAPSSRFSGSSPKFIDDCAGPNGVPPWEVSNFAGSQFGTITLDQATTNSVNTVFAQLIAEVGSEKVAATLDDLEFDREGTRFEREIPEVCSLALGAVPDVTPLEQARAFAGFARRGALPPVQPIRYVATRDDNCIKMYRPNAAKGCEQKADFGYQRFAEQNDVDILNQVLTHVVQGGTATAANIGRPVAGKTGTTQNNVDAWFGGFVPQLATVVWMGYPAEDGGDLVPQMGYCADTELCRPVAGIEVTGGSFPARIWAAYMSEATADMPVASFPTPTDLPDRVINSPEPRPSPSPSPSPTESPDEESPSPTPDEESPSPSPTPSDDGEPSVLPSPSPSGGENGGGSRRGRDP